MMTDLIIGIPQKAPIVAINAKNITITETTVGDVLKEGFDIYIKEGSHSGLKYNEILSSGIFKKYSADRRVFVKKGVLENNNSLAYSSYLLVKNRVVLGSIGLYGSKTEDIALEDSKIIQFKSNEACISAAKAHSISYTLNGVDLLKSVKPESLRESFGEKVQSIPNNPQYNFGSHYRIEWTTNSNHLFWNEYYSTIILDASNSMTSFEITSKMAGG